MKTLKVISVEVFRLLLPLRWNFKHALSERRQTENIVVKLTLDEGSTGYGECVPRHHVTGETAQSVIETLTSDLLPGVLGQTFHSLASLKEYLDSCRLVGAAGCAFELAVVDAVTRGFGESVHSAIGPARRSAVYYSAVIPGVPLHRLKQVALATRLWRFPAVKIKVGMGDDDLARVRIVRETVGNLVNLRVDANGAWDPEQALEKIHALSRFGISAVEEPTQPRQLDDLSYVARHSPIPICVDESLTTLAEAQRLIQRRACHIFNLRLSKCGGFFNSLRLAALARSAGLRYQVGCQVGESSLLSAAGRRLLMMLDDTLYAEGSYGRLLLKEDVARPVVRFGFRGKGRALKGLGLGVEIDAKALARWTVGYSRFSLNGA